MSRPPFDLQPGDHIVDRYGNSGTWHGTIPGHPTHHIVSWDRDRTIVTDHSPAFWTKGATSELAAARAAIAEIEAINTELLINLAGEPRVHLPSILAEWQSRREAIVARWKEQSRE